MTILTESIADQTDNFADAFVHENTVYVYDVMSFKSVLPTPFCLENDSVRKGVF